MTTTNTTSSPFPPTSSFRWVMLGMAVLTAMLVVAMPSLSLPVLFSEISDDLGLSLVQIGVIWGMGSFTGMFIGLLGGTIGDRIGTRKTLIIACLLTGVFGALRGLTVDFTTFLASTFLLGLFQPSIAINLHKMTGQWFPRQQLGRANGLLSGGFGIGLLLGSLLSATVLSPALGGWRPVMYFYGVIAIIISLLWVVIHPRDDNKQEHAGSRSYVPLREGLPHIMRLRNVWLIALGALGIRACTSGLFGYLPTYLREIGWSATNADSALATFYAASILGVIPLSMLSDRFGSRREFLMGSALIMALGTGLLYIVEGPMVWVAVIIAGLFFDGFMSIYNTSVIEVEGVGGTYAGTALGFAALVRNIGGTLAPPLGNSLAIFGPSLPFALWAAMGALGVVAFYMLPKKDVEGER